MPRWTTLLGFSSMFLTLAVPAGARADTSVPAEGAPSVPAAPEAPVVVEAIAQSAQAAPPVEAPAADAPDAVPSFKRRPFIGIWGGVGFANVVHPSLATPHVYGPLLALQVGVTASPHWTLSLEVTNLDRAVNRTTAAERFGAASSFIHTQAECASCVPPPTGGTIVNTVLILNTVGPRVDFTPFGPQGLYLGATGGVGLVSLLDTRVGGAGTARGGFRLNVATVFDVGIEGGVQGQAFAGGSVLMGYAAAVVKLAIDTSSKGRGPGTFVVPMRSRPAATPAPH